MSQNIFILNGPNLNLLGRREPHIYGSTTLTQIQQRCESLAKELDQRCRFHQSNHEGQLVDWIQEAFEQQAAVIINPAGLSYHSVPIYDALKLIDAPVIEVHISNIHARGGVYTKSIISQVATGVICGLGAEGYLLALRSLAATGSNVPKKCP
ncbi:type II 3-dehydroquinate dehydratase [Pseudomonas poae]|uniref:type II 3-dehydroquinate dehydratase n=1 Tax=Pseudomonas poae TaxID=200451 RepID=UPI0030CDF95F